MPTEIHYPYFADPLWWFVYNVEDHEIALSANWDSELASDDPTKRDCYFWTGMWKVRAFSEGDRAPTRITRETFDVLQMYYDGSDRCRYTDYFRALDKRIGVPILKMEADLQLGAPADIQVPAFVCPMWQISYDVNGYRVCVWATASEKIDPASLTLDRSKLVFAGYWKVYHLSKNSGD